MRDPFKIEGPAVIAFSGAALLGFAVLRYTPNRLAECVADLRILFAGRTA